MAQVRSPDSDSSSYLIRRRHGTGDGGMAQGFAHAYAHWFESTEDAKIVIEQWRREYGLTWRWAIVPFLNLLYWRGLRHVSKDFIEPVFFLERAQNSVAAQLCSKLANDLVLNNGQVNG